MTKVSHDSTCRPKILNRVREATRTAIIPSHTDLIIPSLLYFALAKAASHSVAHQSKTSRFPFLPIPGGVHVWQNLAPKCCTSSLPGYQYSSSLLCVSSSTHLDRAAFLFLGFPEMYSQGTPPIKVDCCVRRRCRSSSSCSWNYVLCLFPCNRDFHFHLGHDASMPSAVKLHLKRGAVQHV